VAGRMDGSADGASVLAVCCRDRHRHGRPVSRMVAVRQLIDVLTMSPGDGAAVECDRGSWRGAGRHGGGAMDRLMLVLGLLFVALIGGAIVSLFFRWGPFGG
jgi:hypothetical protein